MQKGMTVRSHQRHIFIIIISFCLKLNGLRENLFTVTTCAILHFSLVSFKINLVKSVKKLMLNQVEELLK
jgi:hypothetical protein